ncbi:MAG: hypothetical protein KGI40_10860 [Xanthomonadaceae bacterium]|nr:hypothetical protein [Xanthomonadaceae bacterium]MDE1959566.1 hypothetical protein [Xanthomonadaceae bacterium]MDE2178623.1 hypothetical protein [Xanthomonadaceae bacterium]MDE2245190.1 hypothetical protein [Xanthomonadaceae bacterium]
MAGKFATSWSLVKASAAVLKSDRELLVFPLLSGLATLLVLASFALPFLAAGGMLHLREVAGTHAGLAAGDYAMLFLFYLCQYTVIFFFNTALVGAAMMRLDGDNPTLGDGLRLAWGRLPAILGYALIAATVGMLLRALEQRAGFIGRWIIGLLGVAWTVATFLVVPVLAATDVDPVTAVKESATLLRRTWGENLIGNAGMGIAFGLLFMALMLAGVGVLALAVAAHSALLMALVAAAVVLAIVLLALVQSALQGIYAAALYRYATGGDAGTGFDPALLGQAFRVKA